MHLVWVTHLHLKLFLRVNLSEYYRRNLHHRNVSSSATGDSSNQGRSQCQDYGGTCTRKFINIYRFVCKNTKKPARSDGLVVLCTPFKSQVRFPLCSFFYFAPTEKLFQIRPWLQHMLKELIMILWCHQMLRMFGTPSKIFSDSQNEKVQALSIDHQTPIGKKKSLIFLQISCFFIFILINFFRCNYLFYYELLRLSGGGRDVTV